MEAAFMTPKPYETLILSVCGRKTLADTHERSADDITGERMTDAAALQALLDDVSIADAIYEKTVDQ